jgi:hypothetical protein
LAFVLQCGSGPVRDLAWKLGPLVVTGSDLLFPLGCCSTALLVYCSLNISTAVSARELQRVGSAPKAAQVHVHFALGPICVLRVRVSSWSSLSSVFCAIWCSVAASSHLILPAENPSKATA